jgi:transcriptional regulator with XRE-family HTH domain
MAEPTTSPGRGPRIESAGAVIRAAREEQGLTLTDLAEKLGWDKGRLSKYENNQLAISSSVLELIGRALGIPPLVLQLRCLKHRYPLLRRRDSRVAVLVEQIVDELCPPSKRSA